MHHLTTAITVTALAALLPAQDLPAELLAGLEYRSIGPSRGGRVTAVTGHRLQPGTFYMGASGGGVWRTDDYGQNWRPLSDGFFATGSIGAIAVAELDPDLIWVATGSDGLRSNVIIGRGVYKSTDGGASWIPMGLEHAGNSGAVLIDPRDPEVVFVAAIGNPFAPNNERGVYRTRDGGKNWNRVLFVSDQTGAVDLEFATDDPDLIYATMWRAERKPWTIISGDDRESGVYRSTDGGNTWQQLTVGLPAGLRGKADLAVTAADPARVYVLIEAPGDEGGVYRSDDRGASWRQVSDSQPIRNRPFYYTNLEAHPTEPDRLWGMAEGFYESEDGGASWRRQRTPHGDNHDMWVNADQPDTFIQANDGGANVTRDGGRTWSTQHNQPTAELYQVDVSDDFPYRLYAGQQDNSTISVPSRAPRSMPGGHTALWEAIGGCETGPAVPKPGDPDIVYAACKGRFGVYNRRTGQEQHYYVGFQNLYGHNPKDLKYRIQRVAPLHVSPHDPDRVYFGSQFVHVTDDGGKTWRTISPDLTAFAPECQVVSGTPITVDVTGEEHFSVLYDIQESPHEAGVIWAGANDGPMHVTRDGGRSWKNVTPVELGPHGRVQNIEVSPHEPAKAYATVLRYQLGDFAPYAFRTTDYGASWTRITTGRNGIPANHPVRVVREDPDRRGLLYAGTEFGLFVSFDDGGHWQSLQRNLPVTPVTDIKVVQGDLVLSTMGRGFWILYDLTPLHGASAAIAGQPAHLFAVRPALRLRGMDSGGFEPVRTADQPDYPPGGAWIDYWLGAPPTGELTLEILDASGAVLRTFTGSAAGETMAEPEEAGMRGPRAERLARPALAGTRGAHRFVWDLRHPGPWHRDARRADRGGPMVAPGTYRARLTAGQWRGDVEFQVRLDPRVAGEGITDTDAAAQTAFSLEVRDTVSLARRTVERVTRARRNATAGSAQAATLAAIEGELVTDRVRYSQPMLMDQLDYLYGNLDRADQAPGTDAVARHAELTAQLTALIARLDEALR